jgi:2-keto-3-deoxy-L-rhamnonate aldolase RhmA
MVEMLKKARDAFGVVSVKAEFEAEGTRIDELLRLLEITRSAGLAMTVKIGGCEAVRDLLEAKQIGVQYVVAPMVETQYAASKYVKAINSVFQPEEQVDMNYLINMETITSFENRKAIVGEIAGSPGADGLVFGRTDFVGSMGWLGEQVNSQETTDYILDVAQLCEASNKQLVVGGGVSPKSLGALRQIHEIRLDRFETRKIVFDANRALASKPEEGLDLAIAFELLWLESKKEYYDRIAGEDSKRLAALKVR